MKMTKRSSPISVDNKSSVFCPLRRTLRHSLRWLILAVSLLACTLIYGNNISFNFSVICIIRPKHSNGNNASVDDPKEAFYYDFSVQQRNALFSAAAIGSILNSFLVTPLIAHYGTRNIFTIYGIISAVTNLLTPMAVQAGFIPLFVSRMIQGTMLPLEMIMISHLSREWSTLRTSATYMLILSAQFQLGPIMTMPFSGMLCDSRLGWPAIYYLLGALNFLGFGIFYFLYRDKPEQHPCINNKELRSIQFGKTVDSQQNKDKEKPLEVPYRQMLTDPVMWILMFTFWTDDLGFQIFIQYGPIYLNRVLGLDVRKTGFLGAMPLLLAMLTKFIAGPVNDRLPWKAERIRINIFSVLNEGGMLITFITLAVLPLAQSVPEWLIQTFYCLVNVFSGLDFLGVIRCSQLIAGPYASIIFATESCVSSMTVLFLPLVVGLVAPNNSVAEWARILIGIAILQMVTLVLFLIFCDSKPRPWAKRKELMTNSDISKTSVKIYPEK